jgi:hypothetical protein
MEPKLPAPNFQPDRTPVPYEYRPEQPLGAVPEVAVEKAAEHVEQRAEVSSQAAPVPMAAPVLPPPVVGVQQPVPITDSKPAVNDMPIVAADEDLIEKEWVDKAKKIVEETKDDPYRREQEVGKLQADYLRKRYGKELGAS